MITQEMLRNLNDESAVFFSEKNVDEWMQKTREQLFLLKKSLTKMLIIVMLPGVSFSALLVYSFFSQSLVLFWTFFIIMSFVFFAIFLFMTFSSLMYFIKMRIKHKKGMWFAELGCGCYRKSIILVPDKDLADAKEGEFLLDKGEPERCRACKENMTIKRLWKKQIGNEV